MLPPSLLLDNEVRRYEMKLRNRFTLLWLLAFSYASYHLAFSVFDIVNASAFSRLVIFLAGFATFLGGFVLFDLLLLRIRRNNDALKNAGPKAGQQL